MSSQVPPPSSSTTFDRNSTPYLWLEIRSSKWVIGITVFLASFTDGFLYSMVVPVLPFSLVDRSGVMPEDVQFWQSILLMVFGAAMTIVAPAVGYYVDNSASHRMPFLGGLALAFVSTVLFAISNSVWMLVLARVFQGLAAGVVYTAGLALLVESVAEDEIGSWIGFALSGMNFGAFLAPFLAGIVYEKAGYYVVFAMGGAVITIDLFFRMFMVEKREAAKWLSQEVPEAHSSTSSTSCLLPKDVLSTSSGIQSTSDEESQICHQQSCGSGSKRYIIEGSRYDELPHEPSHEETPLLISKPFDDQNQNIFQRRFPAMAALLACPAIRASVYGGFVHTSLIASFDAVLPLAVHDKFHWNSSGAGLIFLALTIPSFFGPLFGALSDRYGARIVTLVGFGLASPCLALLGLIRNNTVEDILLFASLLVLIGFGLNIVLSPLAADMSSTVRQLSRDYPETFGNKGAYAQAYSLFDMSFGLGTVFGPAWAGFFYEKTTWSITVITLAIFCASASIPAILYTGKGKHTVSEAIDIIE